MLIIAVIRPKAFIADTLRFAPLSSDPVDDPPLCFDTMIDDDDVSCVQQAIQLRGSHASVEVLVLAYGPVPIEVPLKRFLARGVDGVVRIPLGRGADPRDLARHYQAVAASLQQLSAGLVLLARARCEPAGDPAFTLATALGLSYYRCSSLTELDPLTKDVKIAHSGSNEVTRVALPCLCSCTYQKPDYLTLRQLEQLRTAVVRVESSIECSPAQTAVPQALASIARPVGASEAITSHLKHPYWDEVMLRHYPLLDSELPVFPQIQALGFEFDQRLQRAFALACRQADHSRDRDQEAEAEPPEWSTMGHSGYGLHGPSSIKFSGIRDSFLVPFLITAEPGIRALVKTEQFTRNDRARSEIEFLERASKEFASNQEFLDEERAGPPTCRVFARALMHAARRGDQSLRWQDLFKAATELSIALGDDPYQRPLFADWLLECDLGYTETTPIGRSTNAAAWLAKVGDDIPALDGDFQYLLTLHGESLQLSVCSFVGDFARRESDGLLHPVRAIVLQHSEKYWSFTPVQLAELSDLLSSRSARELDFQRFFERHPDFFRLFDCREVYPHLVIRADDAMLVPDFIITDRRLQRIMVVELKLPTAHLVVHKNQRVRFSMAFYEARAQLLTYRRWLESPANRQAIEQIIGMKLYKPEIAVIIGRNRDFRSELQRRQLHEDNADVRVATYDDIMMYANQHLNILNRIWKK